MPGGRLILVDGMCGSGKSTTAQLLWLHFVKQGYRARWFYEHQSPHPVADRSIASWKTLGATVRDTDETVILESALFQTTVGSLQLLGRGEDDICRHAAEIEEAIADADPAFIYLYQRDAEEALLRIRGRRGAWFDAYLNHVFASTPFAGKIGEFFAAHRRLTDRIFGDLRMPKLAIDNTDEAWGDHNRQITDFLSLPAFECSPPAVDARRLAGRFKHLESGDEIAIATDGVALYLDDEMKTGLIYKGGDAFWIQGMCVEVAFRSDGAGVVNELHLTGDLPNLGKVWTRV